MSAGYIISGYAEPVVRATRSFLVIDTDGIVHVAREYVRPVLGYENNVIEEPIEVTDCDAEVHKSWCEPWRFPPITCIECASKA